MLLQVLTNHKEEKTKKEKEKPFFGILTVLEGVFGACVWVHVSVCMRVGECGCPYKTIPSRT